MPERVNIAVAPVLSFHAMSSSSQTDKGVYRSTSIKLSDRSYELLLLLLLFVYQPVRQCLYGGAMLLNRLDPLLFLVADSQGSTCSPALLPIVDSCHCTLYTDFTMSPALLRTR